MKAPVKASQTIINSVKTILSTLSEEQLNEVPFPRSWTAGQVGDHLFKSYNSWTILIGNTAVASRPIDEHCAQLSRLFLNFDIKLDAEPTDFNYPTDDYIKKKELLSHIDTASGNLINFSSQNNPGLLCMDFKFPGLGYLTRLEWLHFHTVHTQRHIRQLRNIVKHLNIHL